MHNPYDVMAKGLLEGTLSGPCEVRTEEEVVTDAKAMDTVVVPDPARLAELDGRGLFGRFARDAQQVCVFEAYQEPPSPDEADYCLLRVAALQAKKYAAWKAMPASDRGAPPTRARLCLVSAGSPDAARKEWALVQRPGWPAGCLWAGSTRGPYVIVVSELPRTRDTLIARMMGAGETLREAREDLRALPEDEWEHRVVEPLLRLLRNDLPRMGIAEYTAQENAMGIYKEALKAWEEERQTLRNEAMLAHGRAVLRMLLQNVGVTLSADEEARIDACGDLDTLNRWILRASSARAANEVLADADTR